MYTVTFNIHAETAEKLVKMKTLYGMLESASQLARTVHGDHSIVPTGSLDEEDSLAALAKKTEGQIEEIAPALVALHMIVRLKLLAEINANKKGITDDQPNDAETTRGTKGEVS